MDRRLFISAGLAVTVIASVAVITSGVPGFGKEAEARQVSAQGTNTLPGQLGQAVDATATPQTDGAAQAAATEPIYIYPDGSLAPVPESRSPASTGSSQSERRYYEDDEGEEWDEYEEHEREDEDDEWEEDDHERDYRSSVIYSGRTERDDD